MTSYWSMNISTTIIVISLIVMGITLWFGYQNWMRSGQNKRILWTEGLRSLIVALLLFTLMQPEWIKVANKERDPVVAILLDASASMGTADVTTNNLTVMSRGDWVESQKAAKPWSVLEDNSRVVIHAFSTAGTNSSSAFTDGTDISSALTEVMDAHNNLRAVLLLSDGDWNLGEPPSGKASTDLSSREIPIFAVAVGNEKFLPDLALQSVSAPAYGLVEEHIAIPFSIQSHLDRDVKTHITLRSQYGEEATKDITIPAFQLLQDTIVWTPTSRGDHALTLSFTKQVGEFFENNNSASFSIALRRELLKVLVVETAPRWEYRFLRNALMRDPGVDVDCLLLHPELGPGGGINYLSSFPETLDKLSQYDVVFLGDVGVGEDELTLDQLERLKGLVEQQGSGLVFLPGPRGRQLTLPDSAIGDLLPVVLDAKNPEGFGHDRTSGIKLTSLGRGHLLTSLATGEMRNYEVWKRLPGFYWYAPVVKRAEGSEVLAVHATRSNAHGHIPLLVTRPYGSGKVLFMGTDSAWRWRKGVEDMYHYRFWGQVVRWMAHQRHLSHDEGIRVFFTPEDPVRDETVFLHATVFDADGFPLKEGPVYATINSADGSSERITLTPEPGGWGVFKGKFTPTEGGVYNLSVRSDKANRKVSVPIEVTAPRREKLGQPAKLSVMKQLANYRGAWGRTDKLEEIISQIHTLPEPQAIEMPVRVWCHPAWAMLLIVLFAAYWSLRKLAGVV